MRFLLAASTDPSAPRRDLAFDPALMATYMRFNEEMHKAGVLVASEGLNPQTSGARIGVVDGKRALLDGPFTESKELVGGYYVIDVPSRDEAIAWALRAPVGAGSDDVLTVHALTTAEDLPAEILAIIREAAPTWAATYVTRV